MSKSKLYIANKRKKDAVSVLNKIDYDADGLPIGMAEDSASNLSCNFGTDRESVKGGALVGNNSVYINTNIIHKDFQYFKLSFWVRSQLTSTYTSIFSFGGNDSGTIRGSLSFYLGTGGLSYEFLITLTGGRINSIPIPLTVNKWHYVEIENNSSKFSIKLDGEEKVDNIPLNLLYGTISKETLIGARWANSISNPLNDTEIFEVSFYEKNLSGEIINPLGIWKCQEGSGDIIYDSSGNDYHGTVINNHVGFRGSQNIKSFADDEGFTLSDGATYYKDAALTTLIPSGVIIPKLDSVDLPPLKSVAYVTGGVRSDLQYKGKVPSRALFKGSSCFEGDGTAYLSITGLLTTDTITVYGNSDTPTCTIDGRLDVANGDFVYGVKIERSSVEWAFITFAEPIKDAGNHIYSDISGNDNHATLVNGSLANEGKQDKYHWLQNGYTISDGVNYFYDQALTELIPSGFYIPALKSDISKCVAYTTGGVWADTQITQDGKSFLDSGCTLEAISYPELIQSEQDNRFWTDINDDVIEKSHADFTGVETGDRVFNDISEANKVKNIRTHKAALVRRQLLTEKAITNN